MNLKPLRQPHAATAHTPRAGCEPPVHAPGHRRRHSGARTAIALLGAMLAAAAALAAASVPASAQEPPVPPVFDYSHDRDAFIHSLWSDGTTMWVANRTKTVEAFTVATGARDSAKDITVVDDEVIGVRSYWTHGETTTMWVVPYLKSGLSPRYGRIRAYNKETGARVPADEIDISSLNLDDYEAGSWHGALGMASDGTTLWVAGGTEPCCRTSGRLYAFDLATKARKAGSDIPLAAPQGSGWSRRGHYPRGLFTDGTMMWVGQSMSPHGVKAYDISTKERVPSHDLDTGSGTWGMWSDGFHMWVSNFRDTWVRAFPMPDAYKPHLDLDLSVTDQTLIIKSALEYRLHVKRDVASVTVSATAASGSDVAFSVDDADDVDDGHQFSLSLGENTLTVTVTKDSDSRTYTLTVVRVDVDELSDDASLSSLSVAGTPVAGFASDVKQYTVRVDNATESVTVAAAATVSQGEVTITPADAKTGTPGHQVTLEEGFNRVEVQVQSTDGRAEDTYTVTVSREPGAFGRDQYLELTGLGRLHPTDAWSDGSTWWVSYRPGGGLSPEVRAFDVATGARDDDKDITTLDDSGVDNPKPQGLWSDGDTLFVGDMGASEVFEYSLADGDYGTHTAKRTLADIDRDDARGLWSDGTTAWVIDAEGAQILAYAVADWSRAPGKDFTSLDDANTMPMDLWSDGDVMWVLDKMSRRIYGYDMFTKQRLAGMEFSGLDAAGNDWPSGIFSDGDTMWVADYDDYRLYAYRMPVRREVASVTVSGVVIETRPPSGFFGRAARDASSVTVAVVAAVTGDTVTFGTADADLDTDGHQWSLGSGLGENTLSVTVSDGTSTTPYRVTVEKIDVSEVSSDATLRALSVAADGTDLDIGTFSAATPAYTAETESTTVTVAATAAHADAVVTISPADADSVTGGHQVSLGIGDTVVMVEVLASDKKTRLTYSVSITRIMRSSQRQMQSHIQEMAHDADADVALGAAGNNSPLGVWSDGTTVWVADFDDAMVYAYTLDTGARDSAKDITSETMAAAGNGYPTGVWSDGDTMWVADGLDAKVYAYTLDTGARDPSKDIGLAAGNNSPLGIASDADVLWVVNSWTSKVFAYDLDSGVRLPGRDLDALGVAGNRLAMGLATHSETMWVSDLTDGQLFAYDLATGEHVPGLDVEILDAANTSPVGLWSDGSMYLVADLAADKLFAYTSVTSTDEDKVDTTVIKKTVGNDGEDADEDADEDGDEDAVAGLTVGFVSAPTSHESSSFTFQLLFSEAITTSYENLRDDVVTAVRATISGARRVDGRSDLWEITVVPDSNADVEVSVSADAACGESEAVCNADDEHLTNSLALSVPGPPPLTASFADVPVSHDGSSAITLRVQFSEAISTSYVNVRDDVFTVTNGEVTGARRVDGRSDRWEITVAPASGADIDITLSAGAACGTPGAVCTSYAKQLSNNATVTIDGTD